MANTPAQQTHSSQQAVQHTLQTGRDSCPAATHLFAEVGISGARAVGTAHTGAAAWEVLGPHLQAGAESFSRSAAALRHLLVQLTVWLI